MKELAIILQMFEDLTRRLSFEKELTMNRVVTGILVLKKRNKQIKTRNDVVEAL